MKTHSKKSSRWGFTLIELLATLTIMAVIAAILFPFVTNYTKKANRDTTLRSLRILQDAMDRYRAVNDTFGGWPLGGAPTYSTYSTLANADADTILSNIGQASSNQTLRLPVDSISSANVKIVSTAAVVSDSGWEVVWYRRTTNTNAVGVDRKGIEVMNWGGYSATSISNAFQN